MPRDNNFLGVYFRESQERMRHTSDVEQRLLYFLLLFYPIIGVIVSTLYDKMGKEFCIVCITAFIFILLATCFIDRKIRSEHDTYREIAQAVKKVWRYFELHKNGAYLENEHILEPKIVCLDPNKGYGTGKGYRRTLRIIWTMASAILVLIIILGVTSWIAG